LWLNLSPGALTTDYVAAARIADFEDD